MKPLLGRVTVSHSPKLMADINVTPLVDVMLVLLVIFILAAPSLASRLALNLPKANLPTHQQPPPAMKAVRLIKTKSDSLWKWDDAALDEVALQARFKQLAQSAPDTELQVLADESVPYGQVLGLLALAHQQGLTKIGFVASPPSTSTSSTSTSSK